MTVDGEAELTRQLDKMTTQLKTLKSEMKVVTSAFDENTTAQEKATATSEVLRKQIEIQRKYVEELTAGMKRNTIGLEEDSEAYLDWQDKVNQAQAALNKMEAELRDNEKTLSGVDEELKDVSESSEKAEKDFSKLGTGLKAFGGIAAGAVTAVGAVVAGLEGIADSTEEFRTASGKVTTAFESTEKDATLAREAFEEFYKILGDTGTAAESAQLLSSIADEYTDISEWTTIAAGALGRFGDALPINGLIESANETAKVGQLTGNLADALNWAGISEESFNEKLAALSTEEERVALITKTLSDTYGDSSEAFKRNNEVLIASRDAQFDLQESLSGLSESYLSIKNNLLSEFIPSVATAADGLTMLFEGNKDGAAKISEGIEAMTASITEAAPEIFELGGTVLTSLLEGIVDAAPSMADGAIDVIFTLTESVIDMLPEVGDAATDIVIALVDGLAENGDELIEGAVDSVLTIVAGLTKPDTLENLIDAAIDLTVAIISGLAKSAPLLVAAAPDIVFNIITGILSATPDILDAGGEIVISVIDGIVACGAELLDAGADIVEDIKDGFEDKVNEAKTWGKDLMDNFIGGIKAKWNDLTSTVYNVAQTVKDFIGFSEPEKGPLSNFHTYAPDMMMLFAQGIKENEHLITDQIAKSFDLEMAISSATGSTTSKSYNYGGFSINVYGAEGQDPNEIADAVMYKVQEAIYRKEATYG